MPKGSAELIAARRDEIVEACAELYDNLSFKEITIGAISKKTTFSRPSVYNYFRTKEEIFLALLGREYGEWAKDLMELAENPVSKSEFPSRFAVILGKRRRMLKLVAMNLYDMEAGSRLENLVEFKKMYNSSLQAAEKCFKAHFTGAPEERARQFIYTLFPFLFGVYPYTEATEKQKRAMDIAGVRYQPYTVESLVELLIRQLTENCR